MASEISQGCMERSLWGFFQQKMLLKHFDVSISEELCTFAQD